MSETKCQARVIGTGTYLPKKVLSNEDLEKMVETSNEWIYTRTGIKERRIAEPDEYPSTMGAKAAKNALSDASLNPEQIDMIIVSTMTSDFQSSSTAALIQHEIGAVNAAAVDLQAACTGFIYALSIAKAYIESGMYRNVLLVAAEKMSSFINYEDRNTCVLFGDGAAAAIVSNQDSSSSRPGLALTAISLSANGGLADLFLVPAGGSRLPASAETVATGQHFVKMQGQELFKQAVRSATQVAKACLDLVELSEKDIRWLVPHQANVRIIDALAKSFEIDQSKVIKTIEKYGNTSAASIPIALSELRAENRLQKGERLLLLGFGAGFTSGAAVLTQL